MNGRRLSILLAVWNGAAFLPAQLDSIAGQSFDDWDLIAGDDGSDDESLRILEDFAARMTGHRVDISPGPRAGGTMHFLSLLTKAPPEAHWVAFADQDDVWLPDKLQRAVEMLESAPDDVPCLYCSRIWVTGPDLENPVASPAWQKPVGFRNALVQNVAPGNTIVLNRKAADLAQRAAGAALAVKGLPAHDWWLYQIITGAGGQVIFDNQPSLYYRQHGANQLGANHGLAAALIRSRKLLNGTYSRWNTANITALNAARHCLTRENQTCLENFAALRDKPIWQRVRALAGLKLYRQTPLTQAALWSAAILGRI